MKKQLKKIGQLAGGILLVGGSLAILAWRQPELFVCLIMVAVGSTLLKAGLKR